MLKNNLSLRRHISSISSQATLLLDVDQKKHHYLTQKSGTQIRQLGKKESTKQVENYTLFVYLRDGRKRDWSQNTDKKPKMFKDKNVTDTS